MVLRFSYRNTSILSESVQFLYFSNLKLLSSPFYLFLFIEIKVLERFEVILHSSYYHKGFVGTITEIVSAKKTEIKALFN